MSAPARESHSRSLAKAVSWRITGTLDTFVLSYLITGNAHAAGSIAVSELITKIGLYYAHERAWTNLRWGKRFGLSRVGEAHWRSLAKAVSWRVTAGIDTFLLSYIFTGSLVFASSIAATELLTKIGIYYFHERIWSNVAWGKESGATPRATSVETDTGCGPATVPA